MARLKNASRVEKMSAGAGSLGAAEARSSSHSSYSHSSSSHSSEVCKVRPRKRGRDDEAMNVAGAAGAVDVASAAGAASAGPRSKRARVKGKGRGDVAGTGTPSSSSAFCGICYGHINASGAGEATTCCTNDCGERLHLTCLGLEAADAIGRSDLYCPGCVFMMLPLPPLSGHEEDEVDDEEEEEEEDDDSAGATSTTSSSAIQALKGKGKGKGKEKTVVRRRTPRPFAIATCEVPYESIDKVLRNRFPLITAVTRKYLNVYHCDVSLGERRWQVVMGQNYLGRFVDERVSLQLILLRSRTRFISLTHTSTFCPPPWVPNPDCCVCRCGRNRRARAAGERGGSDQVPWHEAWELSYS